MPFFPTTYFPRHHLAQSLGAACIARLWLGFAWLMLLSLCRSASLGFAWLGSLGFTQLSFARLASLGSLGLRRFAQPRILARCSHHWLPSLSLRRLASALARVARLASRAKRHSASLDLRRWLARVFPGLLRWRRPWLAACVAGSFAGARFSSHRSALCSALRHFAWPRVAGSRCWLAARVAGSRRSACVSVSSPRIAWLALLCSCSFQ